MKNRPFRERLGFAPEGIRTGWRRENSFGAQTRLAAPTISLAAPVVGVALVADAAPRFLAEIGW